MERLELWVRAGRVVPSDALSIKTSRASGPGGQHVNKTESRVTLELDLSVLDGVWPENDCARVRQNLASRITSDGRIQVHVDTYRQQRRNLDAARERLASLLQRALHVPKARRPTQPSKGAKRRRLDAKRREGEKKKMRAKVRFDS